MLSEGQANSKDGADDKGASDDFERQRELFEQQQRVQQRKESLEHLFEKNKFLQKFDDFLVRRSQADRERAAEKEREARNTIKLAIVGKLDDIRKNS